MQQSSRIDSLLELLEKEPDDVFLNYALGIEYSSRPGALEIAGQQYEKVLRLDKDYIPAYYQLGKLFETADPRRALTFYKTGLQKAKEQKNNKAINEFGEAVFLLED